MIEYTLRQLEVFAAAAEQESLTRAAELLHLTQSTASTHLRTLEQVLGVTLLLRRGQGGVALSEDGCTLWPKKSCPSARPCRKRRRIPTGSPPCR